jgi:uncharacterized protein YraI
MSPILIIGLVVLIVLLIAAIAFVIIGNDGEPSTPPPPEVSVPTPLPGLPSATALEAVNVRSGPGTNYPSYGVAPQGAQGEVIGVSPDGGWWVVDVPTEYSPDGIGWVSAEYVQTENVGDVPVVEPPPPPPPVNVDPPEEGAPTATALDYINVRSGSGTEYPSYGVAAPGAQAEVIGVSSDGDWWVVSISTEYAPDGRGWVTADWVSVENADDVPVIEPPPMP